MRVEDTPQGQLAIVLHSCDLVTQTPPVASPLSLRHRGHPAVLEAGMDPSSPPTSSDPSHSAEPSSANSFVPRPFPPPSLASIPHEYVVNSLRRLAPQYWNNTESADCSISTYPAA